MGKEARGRQAQPSAEVENDYLSKEDRFKAIEEFGKKVGAAKRTGRYYDIPKAVVDAYNMPVYKKQKKMRQKFDRPTGNFPKGI
jgi:hypothetical protein